MKEIEYSELEKLIEESIHKWAKENDIKEYDDQYSDFNYVDALTIASDITLQLYLEQDGEGIKIISDKAK